MLFVLNVIKIPSFRKDLIVNVNMYLFRFHRRNFLFLFVHILEMGYINGWPSYKLYIFEHLCLGIRKSFDFIERHDIIHELLSQTAFDNPKCDLV